MEFIAREKLKKRNIVTTPGGLKGKIIEIKFGLAKVLILDSGKILEDVRIDELRHVKEKKALSEGIIVDDNTHGIIKTKSYKQMGMTKRDYEILQNRKKGEQARKNRISDDLARLDTEGMDELLRS